MTDVKSRILKLIENKQIEEAKDLLNEYNDAQTEKDHKSMEDENRILESLSATTVAELLERFPEGVVISPKGQIFVTLAAVSSLQYLSAHYPVPPSHGGYVVVAAPNYQEGDEKFGVSKKE